MSATVLLVDDEPDLLEGLAAALGKRGYRVLTACDGTEVLELLDRQAIDLVVTDDLMPELSGRALIAALRTEPRWARLPVILASAYAPPEAGQTPAATFLHKPFGLAELVRAIEAALAAG